MRDILRRCRFTPYRRGAGPTFSLTTWDTHQTREGKTQIGYRLTMREPGARRSVTLFEGEDFFCPPLNCTDSDESVGALMGFLTLRPRDTDPEYFANYTPAQMAYAEDHAEALAGQVLARFGDC